MLTIGITGHRPKTLNCDYSFTNPTAYAIQTQIEEYFNISKPDQIISGMALGADWYAVNVAIKLNIPFIAAVPFKGQENIWPKPLQLIYDSLLKSAKEIVIVSQGTFSKEKLQIRNEYIVDHSNQILAIWNKKPKGGTYNAVSYAFKQKKPIHTINPLELNYETSEKQNSA